MELKRDLRLIDIFSIAAGAMISSGIFILPGIAFSRTGPAVFVSYGFAGLLALMGIFNIIELSTAMPRAGGDYFFFTRSFGPLIGTVSGLLSWLALSLKSAFAVYGLAKVIYLVTGLSLLPVGVIVTLLFLALNIFGVKAASRFEVSLVVSLIALMGVYIAFGIGRVDIERYVPFAPEGFNAVLSTTGFVFISFGGLIKVASVAEEVRNPSRDIPLGLISSTLVVSILYVFLLFVTVGVLPAEQLTGSLTPIADSARVFLGRPGYVIITIAAVLAFITTANAGIMAASRYPMALSRDNLLPGFIGRVNERFQTPVRSILLTGVFITGALFLDLDMLVKSASTVVLTSYLLSCAAVLILRSSGIQNYQPTFRSPFYPWLQIFGIVIFGFLIVDIGRQAIEISLAFVLAGILIYLFYGRTRITGEYALLHILERITDRRLTHHGLEQEFLEILHRRDEVVMDRFDRLIASAPLLDLDGPLQMDAFFDRLADECSCEFSMHRDEMFRLLHEREGQSTTAITPFVAIPHIIIEGEGTFELVIARCSEGIIFSEERKAVKAVFLLMGTLDERSFHLQALAAIAQIVHHPDFERLWMSSRDKDQLRDILLLSNRRRME